jgi:nitronate monooxygenase
MKDLKNKFLSDLNIIYPIIMAPMFLVSNEAMIKSGISEGVMSVFPSLNYRSDEELNSLLSRLNDFKLDKKGNYGVNIIVQKSNIYYKKHLDICVQNKVPFYITSLGNPSEVISKAHAYGAKVYCDVTNLKHAEKCFEHGCDGFIVVGQGAGGHAGPHPLHVLIPLLKSKFPNIPIVAAGGIVSGEAILSLEVVGAVGVSVGTRFIASEEATVNDNYKKGIVNAGVDDIVLTEKLSGTPCTIIDTPAAKKMGYNLSWFDKLMVKNKKLRKYYKMFIQLKGMKRVENSAKSKGSYDELWCAGKSSALIDDIKTCEDIIINMMTEYNTALKKFIK